MEYNITWKKKKKKSQGKWSLPPPPHKKKLGKILKWKHLMKRETGKVS